VAVGALTVRSGNPYPNAPLQPSQGSRTNTGDPSQFLHSMERAVGLPVADDGPRPTWAHPGKRVQHRDVGRVQINESGPRRRVWSPRLS
jgi:hypothetical protein